MEVFCTTMVKGFKSRVVESGKITLIALMLLHLLQMAAEEEGRKLPSSGLLRSKYCHTHDAMLMIAAKKGHLVVAR